MARRDAEKAFIVRIFGISLTTHLGHLNVRRWAAPLKTLNMDTFVLRLQIPNEVCRHAGWIQVPPCR